MVQKGAMQKDIRGILYQKAFRKRSPINGTFELTPCCNMNCKMCYIRMSEEEMRQRGELRSAEEWIALGEECVKRGTLFLLLTGGEPMLHREFRQIYEALHKMGLIITLNTNGTLVTEEFAEWIKQYPPTRINITLYGSSNETYARLCGHPKGYDAACRGIELLSNAGIYVNINSSFTPENVGDMHEIFSYAKCRNLTITGACYMFPPVRSAKDGVLEENVRFTAKEAGEARAWTERLKMGDEAAKRVVEQLENGNFETLESDEDCVRTNDERMNCVAGKSSFWVNWKGEMTPCGMMNSPVVYPFQNGFAESWKTLVELTEPLCLPPACSGCHLRRACQVCGALAIAEGEGDSTKKPEYLCEMTRAYIEKFKSFREELDWTKDSENDSNQ